MMKLNMLQKKGWVFLGGLLLGSASLVGQSFDLEEIRKAKPIKFSGGLNANGVFSAGLPNTSSPFDVYVAGNLNVSLYGVINMPVTVNYSSRKISFSQGYNFNQFSIAPTYKWITAYAGTNYMTFSPYSLNGHQYVGGGVELKPTAKWLIKAMAGRLIRGQFEDTLVTGPTFRRMGYGYHVQYNPGTYRIGLSMFRAMDDASSLPLEQRNFKGNVIHAKENSVVGLHLGTTLFHALQIQVDYHNSVLTKDRSPNYERVRIPSLAGILLSTNATSESFHAFKTSLTYNMAATKTLIGVGYERVDPNYLTLGGYYFVNDLENYTVQAGQSLLENNLTLNANVGFQRDDIRKTKASQQTRVVGAVQANWNVNESLTMGLNFSNFQSYKFLNDTYSRLVRVPGIPIDTLNFALISQTYGFNLTKILRKTEERQSSLSANSSYLASRNRVGENFDPKATSGIWNGNLNYALSFLPQKMGGNVGLSIFRNDLPEGLIQGIGPTLAIQKTFIENLSTNLSVGAFSTSTRLAEPASSTRSSAINASVVASYSVGKGHQFNLNTSFVKSFSNQFLNGNIGYSYSF